MTFSRLSREIELLSAILRLIRSTLAREKAKNDLAVSFVTSCFPFLSSRDWDRSPIAGSSHREVPAELFTGMKYC